MNHIRKRDQLSEQVEQIRSVVQRHALPDFVTGFDIRLGEFDGDPAVWVTFNTLVSDTMSDRDRDARTEAVARLRETIQADLLVQIEDRFPYFRFTESQAGPVNPG